MIFFPINCKVEIRILQIVFFVLISLGGSKTQSQSQPQLQSIDSLTKALKFDLTDSAKLNTLVNIADLYISTDKEKSIKYYNQALKHTINSDKRAHLLNAIGVQYWSLGSYEDALNYYHQSLSIYRELNDSTKIGRVTNNVASANWYLGKWNDALQIYQESLIYRKALNDLKGVSNILNNIGLVYQDFGVYDEALNYHNQALEIALKINNAAAISYSYSNIGICYMMKEEFESALEFHKRGFTIFSKKYNNGSYSYFLTNIGMVFRKLNQLDSALYYFNQSLEQARLINNKYRIADAEYNLGKSYLTLGEIKTAANYIAKSNTSALANNYKDLLRDNQFALTEIEEAKGNTKMALVYFKNATAIRDSLFNKNEISKFIEITITQINEKEENEKALLRESIEIQQETIREEKLIRWFIIGGVLFLLGALIYIARSHKSIEKLNSQLRKSEKELKQSNEDKLKFFSIISHDLRNPFSSIIGLSNLLTLEIKTNNIENIGMYANRIHNSSQRAMGLLSNLMDWTLSQTGKMTFMVEKMDINSNIHENILLFDDMAQQKNIIISHKIDNLINVSADKSMINTVLRNLISNAIKFTENGGSIHISSKIKQNNVEVSVTDNGIGLAKASLEKLFRIDTKFSTTGTLDEGGTGLGLMLCKEFINKHKGDIWVVSELGKGSTFYFTLPYLAD